MQVPGFLCYSVAVHVRFFVAVLVLFVRILFI